MVAPAMTLAEITAIGAAILTVLGILVVLILLMRRKNARVEALHGKESIKEPAGEPAPTPSAETAPARPTASAPVAASPAGGDSTRTEVRSSNSRETVQSIARHVFVSYSHSDREFANRLITDLRDTGIPIWIDHEGLRAGTPNWDHAIRKAIDASFAILLIASPDSQNSDVVQGEVAIARTRDCPIFPVWARGDIWEECVPIDLIRAQRFDCRGREYDTQSQAIATTLRELMHARMPRLITVGGEYDVPPGYLDLSIARTNTRLAIRPEAFASLDELLEALYLPYLSATYSPFSYGRDYLLCSRRSNAGFRLLAVPWLWLVQHEEGVPLAALSGTWAAAPLSEYGLTPDSAWEMVDAVNFMVGIATNVAELGRDILGLASRYTEEKMLMMLIVAADGVLRRHNGVFEHNRTTFMRVQASNTVAEQKFAYKLVLALGPGKSYEYSASLKDRAIVYQGPWERSSATLRFLDEAQR